MRPSRRALVFAVVLSACTSTAPFVDPTAPPVVTTTPARAGLTFAVKGDWGEGGDAQRRITRRMCALRASVPFRFVVTTGDNFYDPDGRATDRTYDGPERCLYEQRGHRWRAVWGNHDVAGGSTGDVLGAPARYYVWTAGGVDFFMLDSNRAGDRAQRAWLESGLKRSRARVKVAVFHHPPFSAGDFRIGDEGVRRAWVPLFERYGVSLVLTGHQHTYEHHRRDGIDYVISGGGGGGLYRCAREVPTLVECDERHHFLLVRILGARISVTAYGPEGDIIDTFVIRA